MSLFIENTSINVEFLKNRAGEITAGVILVSITEIVSDCQQIGTGALLIINNDILDLFWGNHCFFFYLTLIAKMKLEQCQPQVQQFC